MAESTHITRVKATDTKPEKKAVELKQPTSPKKSSPKSGNGFTRALRAIGGYFAGAWAELKQVRWPNRRATWGLTLAVLLFTAFFLVLVTGLDFLFKYLFELIIV